MNKYGLFLLVALLMVTLPVTSAASSVQVKLIEFYLGGESVETIANPPSSKTLTLGSEYVGQETARIVITVVNPDGMNVTWDLWTGLVGSAIKGESGVPIGEQTSGSTWRATTDAKIIIITVTGTVDWENLQEAAPVIILRYSTNEDVLTPLLTFSLKVSEPSGGPKVEAQAAITELETELSGSNLPAYRRSYYESQLYKAKLYLQNEAYDSALITAQTALNDLRAELAEYNSPVNVVFRFLYNNVMLVAGLAGIAALVLFASRLWKGGPVTMP